LLLLLLLLPSLLLLLLLLLLIAGEPFCMTPSAKAAGSYVTFLRHTAVRSG
jgi:hypothetical protein